MRSSATHQRPFLMATMILSAFILRGRGFRGCYGCGVPACAYTLLCGWPIGAAETPVVALAQRRQCTPPATPVTVKKGAPCKPCSPTRPDPCPPSGRLSRSLRAAPHAASAPPHMPRAARAPLALLLVLAPRLVVAPSRLLPAAGLSPLCRGQTRRPVSPGTRSHSERERRI